MRAPRASTGASAPDWGRVYAELSQLRFRNARRRQILYELRPAVHRRERDRLAHRARARGSGVPDMGQRSRRRFGRGATTPRRLAERAVAHECGSRRPGSQQHPAKSQPRARHLWKRTLDAAFWQESAPDAWPAAPNEPAVDALASDEPGELLATVLPSVTGDPNDALETNQTSALALLDQLRAAILTSGTWRLRRSAGRRL